MPTVHDFSEAELWYIYEALTTATFVGATQTEIFEIFNGTNPQGLATSLFNTHNNFPLADLFTETVSGTDQTISNLLVETLSGSKLKLANIEYNSYTKLNSIDTKVATSANQTTANNYLNLIDAQTADTASHTQTTNTYLSSLRTPVIISTSASATISGQLHNISFANVGSAVGTITVNGTTVNLPVGATVSYDAGGNNNRFATNIFSYDGTGTTLLIQYIS